MKKYTKFLADTKAYAVVEATILFPIIMMIFAGLVLLAMYLPTRAVLQQATQYAATALATEQSDTWLEYDTGAMKYNWTRNPGNVYVDFLVSLFTRDLNSDAKTIVSKLEGKSLTSRTGKLSVECSAVNYVIYKEIIVTATRTIPVPVDLSFVKFPKEIPITVSSSAVVLNGDEFVRNLDLAAEFVEYLANMYNVDFYALTGAINKVFEIMGI